MDVWFANGQTNIIFRVYINDASLLNGAGKTGLLFSSTGLLISTIADNEASATTYSQAGSTIETVTTLGTFAAPTATKCRFREVDATNFPGLYELQVADARWAVSGAKYVDVSLPPVSGLGTVPVRRRVQLTSVNPQLADFGLNSAALPSLPVANSWGEALFLADIMGGRFGTAQAGAASTITLDAGANSTDSAYVGYGVFLYGGTGGGIRGVGQFRTIVAYNGTTKVATVDRVWGTNPDNTTKFMLLPRVAENVLLWNGSPIATPDTAGYPKVTLKSGTGAGEVNLSSGAVLLQATQTGVTIPTVTTLTNAPPDSAGVTTLLSRLSALRAGYLDNLSAGAVATAAALTSLQTDVTTALARLGAFTGTGVNTVLGFLRAMSRNDLAAPSDVGGTYDPTADSLQAIASGTTPSGIAVSVWNYLVSSAGTDITKMGGYIAVFLAAIRAKTDTIGTSTLTAVSPVTAAGNLVLVQGDDYLAADGRSFDFTYTSQPSFIGASALLRFAPLGSNSSIALDSVPTYFLTGTILSATEVRFEMTSAQSAHLPADIKGGQAVRFEIQITLSDGSVITPTPLNQGKVSVAPQAAP